MTETDLIVAIIINNVLFALMSSGAQGAQGAPGAVALSPSLTGRKTIPYSAGSDWSLSFDPAFGPPVYFAFVHGDAVFPTEDFDQAAFVINQPGALTALHVFMNQVDLSADVEATLEIGVYYARQPSTTPQLANGYRVIIHMTVPHDIVTRYDSVDADVGQAAPFPLLPGDRVALSIRSVLGTIDVNLISSLVFGVNGSITGSIRV